MNIVYTLNDAFCPQLCASIASLCDNNKKSKSITFYIVSYGIKEENKKKITKFVDSYKRKIEFIEVNDLKKYFDFDFDTFGWNPITLGRLLIDKLLPKKIERVLYLDCDIIVRGDISGLYDLDLKEKTLAMSIEPTINMKRIENLKMNNHPYCNAGVILVDLNKWRKNNTGNTIINYYREHNGRLFAVDQDAINGSMHNEIMIISPRYNFYNVFYQYNYRVLKNNLKPINYEDYISKKDYEESKRNPLIVHYLGEERPWRKGNTHKYKKDYKKYLEMTPFCNTPDEKGWELYFVAWRVFNFLIKPFPSLRLKIINGLIPTFMKWRSKQNKKETVKIYVGAFNKLNNINEKCYVPIQLGKANSKIELDCIGDNTGDNISKENSSYCELTAQYWFWKNTNDDIVGLVHYRRFFYKNIFKNVKNVLSENDIRKILKKNDIIVSEKGYTFKKTVKEKYIESHIESDYELCRKCIKKKFPKYLDSFDKVFSGNSYSPFNMIIARKEILDKYSEWIFSVYNEMSKYINYEDGRSNYNRRTFGFMGERLLNVWLMENKDYKIKYLPVINIEENVLKQRIIYIIKKIFGRFF